MTSWKDAPCLLAILVAYGLAGHLDYQDAVAMEEAMRDDMPPPCSAPPCSAPPGVTAARASLSPTDVRPTRLGPTAAISHPACGPFDQ